MSPPVKAATMDPASADYEARFSKVWLESTIGVPVTSFCYPYTDAPQVLQSAVYGAGYKQARGGRVARPDKFMRRGDGANLLNVTCFHVGPQTVGSVEQWLHEAMFRDAWLTLMFHGVGDERKWDNISCIDFAGILDKLTSFSTKVVTFAEGAEWYRSGR